MREVSAEVGTVVGTVVGIVVVVPSTGNVVIRLSVEGIVVVVGSVVVVVVGSVVVGKVVEMHDYGREKYASIDVYGQRLTALYDGSVGDTVDVTVPVESVTIKDKSIDIIIV